MTSGQLARFAIVIAVLSVALVVSMGWAMDDYLAALGVMALALVLTAAVLGAVWWAVNG